MPIFLNGQAGVRLYLLPLREGNRFYMIELTDLSDRSFVLNSELIESITSIPEHKISPDKRQLLPGQGNSVWK